MEEKSDNEQQRTERPSAKGKKWLQWVLVALLVLSLASSGYLWGQLRSARQNENQLKKDKQQLQQQIEKLRKQASTSPAGATQEAACNDTPSTSMKENIKAALDSKNTAVFSTYVTSPVKYVLAASEYGGDVSPDEAATSLEYTHSATGPWDFNLPAATVAGYDAGFYTDYFDDTTYEGKAASGMVVSFDFNCDGKIKQIFVAADASLL